MSVSKDLLSHAVSIAAGLSSGSLSALVMFPTEGLKKRSQSNQPKIGFKLSDLKTFSISNIKILYTGCVGFVLSVGPTTLVQTLTYNFLNKTNIFGEKSPFVPFISGGIGAICSSLVEHLVLTQQYRRNEGKPVGPIGAYKILHQKGVFKPFTGFLPLVFRESIFGGLALNVADAFARNVSERFGSHFYFPSQILIGILGALLTHPADTVATNLQKNLKFGQKETLSQIVRRIYAGEGIKGFYKGGAYRVALFTGCMMIISLTRLPIENVLKKSITLD